MDNRVRWRRLARLAVPVLVLLLGLSACSGDGGGDAPVTPLRGDLVSSDRHGTVSTTTLATILSGAGITLEPSVAPTYATDFYAVSYRTVAPDGALVIATGLLLVPQKAGGSSPMLSVQHGTITGQARAPSSFDTTNPATYSSDTLAGLVAASLGYVVVMPDYLGYGTSSGLFHPFVQADTLASASIDMLRAARTALQRLGAATNGQLFLAGYSEGGYATLAMQREIETALAAEFSITASEPGAGPYDLSGTTRLILQQPDLAGTAEPAHLAFFIIAYETYTSSPSGLAYYFTPLALSCVGSNFSNGWYGATDSGSFDACVNSTVTTDILNSAFVDAFNSNDASVAALQQQIARNDIYDWSPQVPTRLFFSPHDEVVPAANTETAHQTMVGNGSTTMELAACPLTTPPNFHVSCGQAFFNDVVLNFGRYALDL
jgi:pimeloyl-ACP methyl ester carboxylesterase